MSASPTLTWNRATRITWAYTWRAGAVLFLIECVGWIIGTPLARAFASLSPSTNLVKLSGLILLILKIVVLFLVSVWAIKVALSKQYPDFQVVLAPPAFF